MAASKFQVRTYPWNSFLDKFTQCEFSLSELKLLDEENLPIPLVSSAHWQLCKRIYANPKVTRLQEVTAIHVRRGEVNQTTYKDFITSNTRHSRLLKGAEVGRYRTNSKLSQGEQQWFDERSFLKCYSPWKLAQLSRIATQRITGVDEKQRIVATIIAGPCYFADSTNSIDVGTNDEEWLRYLLGLLNSRLYQWRFKMTSTNNNVGTNELDCMPYLDVAANDPDRQRLVALVGKMLKINKEHPGGRLEVSGTTSDQLNSLNDEANKIVNRMYGLSANDTEVIEGNVDPANSTVEDE